ncbi:hypothetical protein OH690_01125 [Escherichia coli]|nr:hypothetical protein [Escherichia coli]
MTADTGNAGLVFLHLLQSEETLTLTFLSRCFEFISQSLQWFVIHNLTFFDVGMNISKSGNDKLITGSGCGQ